MYGWTFGCMYVCIHECMYVCTYASLSLSLSLALALSLSLCLCLCACQHLCIRVYIYVCVCGCVCTCLYMCVCVYMFIYVCAYTYMYVCVSACVWICLRLLVSAVAPKGSFSIHLYVYLVVHRLTFSLLPSKDEPALQGNVEITVEKAVLVTANWGLHHRAAWWPSNQVRYSSIRAFVHLLRQASEC